MRRVSENFGQSREMSIKKYKKSTNFTILANFEQLKGKILGSLTKTVDS
jgi:hypothetical protein